MFSIIKIVKQICLVKLNDRPDKTNRDDLPKRGASALHNAGTAQRRKELPAGIVPGRTAKSKNNGSYFPLI